MFGVDALAEAVFMQNDVAVASADSLVAAVDGDTGLPAGRQAGELETAAVGLEGEKKRGDQDQYFHGGFTQVCRLEK